MIIIDDVALHIWQEFRHEKPEKRIALIDAYEKAQRDCVFAGAGICDRHEMQEETKRPDREVEASCDKTTPVRSAIG